MTSKRKPTKNWQRLASEIYRPFAEGAGLSDYDFSEVAATALFERETFGKGAVAVSNGYAQGKRLVDITVAMWMEDLYPTATLPPLLFPWELYEDPGLPNWWLDKVIPADRTWRIRDEA